MVEKFKALAEESRLRILSLIMDHDMCVCEIETSLNLTQPNVSKHLTVLKQCGILFSYKKAQWVYYGISDKFKQEHNELFQYLYVKLKELPTYENDYIEYYKCKLQDVCTKSKKEAKRSVEHEQRENE